MDIKRLALLLTVAAHVCMTAWGEESVCQISDGDHYVNGLYYHVGKNSVAELSSTDAGLTDITVPPTITIDNKTYSVNIIGSNAFRNCSQTLTSVTITNAFIIKDNAFKDCKKLEHVKLAEETAAIGEAAFMGCENLSEIDIPATALVNSFSSIFEGCYRLRAINIDPNDAEYRSEYGVVLRKGRRTDAIEYVPNGYYGPGDGTYMSPDNARSVSEGAFRGSSLVNIEFSPEIAEVKAKAFEDCEDLEEIHFWNGRCRIASDNFRNCPNLKALYFRIDGVEQKMTISEWEARQTNKKTDESDAKNSLASVEKEQPVVQSQPKAEIDIVDTGIPVISRVNKNTFAIIFANEDYQKETKVDYAKNDGEIFKDYCHKTFGLPENNIHFVANATMNNFIDELDWLQQVCNAYDGEASVIFYYAGHGIPDETSGSAYLIPADGNSRLLRTCFNINELYETLGKLPAKKVTVLMDACFSGAKRDGGMLASARGVAIKAKASAPKGSMIVLSAAQGNETAYKYEAGKHGLFTYFLLKKLKDSKGNVTLGELSQYIQNQVKRYSIVENGKSQTPTVQASDNLKGSWESMMIE